MIAGKTGFVCIKCSILMFEFLCAQGSPSDSVAGDGGGWMKSR